MAPAPRPAPAPPARPSDSPTKRAAASSWSPAYGYPRRRRWFPASPTHAANESPRGRETLQLMCRARSPQRHSSVMRRRCFAVPEHGGRPRAPLGRSRRPAAPARPPEFTAATPPCLARDRRTTLLSYDKLLSEKSPSLQPCRPFGEGFRTTIGRLLSGNIPVSRAYLTTLDALRAANSPARDVSSRVPAKSQLSQTRDPPPRAPYEALLCTGRNTGPSAIIHVYRTRTGAGVVNEPDERRSCRRGRPDPRDYDVKSTPASPRQFAARLGVPSPPRITQPFCRPLPALLFARLSRPSARC